MEGTLINSAGFQWIVSRDMMANQAIAITRARFLSSSNSICVAIVVLVHINPVGAEC
jgi:hypothetical protein